ncbi:MAG: ubiquinone-binding protein [Gammaproteobacteria bacterium HGW-Gammaproteobacteria-10]|nr:MAG: ubiquinone-binding protein [Gammaproteobacteria bacterium HGW-Gammaproteobacteria-10]HBA65556.1 ubiquinone-binding protein [Methylococcaceae bacterium]
MTKICLQARVEYSPSQMFDLVSDIGTYADFIPLCTRSVVNEKCDEWVKATVTMAKGRVGFSFATINFLTKNRAIRMSLVEGPFKVLNGVWLFDPWKDHGSEISLELEFEFANQIISLAFSPLFKKLCDSMIDSFKKQAAMRYGEANEQ